MPLTAITTSSYTDPSVVITTATSPAAPVVSRSSSLFTYAVIAGGLYWAWTRGWLRGLENKLGLNTGGSK